MLTATLALCALTLSPFAQAVGDPRPTPAQVKTTCKALQQAFLPGAEADLATQALRQAQECVHPDVIALIDTRGLRSKLPDVRSASIETLARMEHPDALGALEGALKRDKKELEESPPLHAALLRAIARHGKEQSIPLLVEDLFQSPDNGVINARILGLGHIRSKTSVAELIRLMRSAPRPGVAAHMDEFRVALAVLTGEDKGTDQELWINWYGDHDKTLEIAPRPGTLPPALERRWESYWGEGGKGRRRRGGDGRDR